MITNNKPLDYTSHQHLGVVERKTPLIPYLVAERVLYHQFPPTPEGDAAREAAIRNLCGRADYHYATNLTVRRNLNSKDCLEYLESWMTHWAKSMGYMAISAHWTGEWR